MNTSKNEQNQGNQGVNIINRVIASRTARTLFLEFHIPEREALTGDGYWSCYPKDEEQKAAWIQSGIAKGWKHIER
tara:strand:- start:702 stop:929 length:228 start_codon:yes stop_codon:yes gene_type:complete